MNMYFDSTATQKPSRLAIDTYIDVSVAKWFNPSSTQYEGGYVAKKLLNESRKIIAECIGASPEQIIFTSGATEGANWILQKQINREDALIVSMAEHPAVYETAKHITRNNTIFLPVCSDGCVAEDDLFETLYNNSHEGLKTLVAIMDSNNETGAINDTKDLVALSHRFQNTEYFCDMTQSFAHSLNYNVDDLGVDYAIASAQKFGGFKGAGFLYVKNPKDLKPFMYGGHQEFGKRPGTENVAAIYSSAVQFRESCAIRSDDYKKVKLLRDHLVEKLKADGWIINGGTNVLPSIVSATMPGCNAQRLVYHLGMDSLCVGTGSACSSGETKPSRVLIAMGMNEEEANGTIRISLDPSHSIDSIDYLVERIKYHGC